MRREIAVLACIMWAPSAQAACNIVNGVAYGDCAGVTVNTGREPFRTIDNHGTLSGISAGAHVLDGGTLSVSGTADHVIVDAGGSALITGVVTRLEVSGVANVSGQVNTLVLSDGGQVTIEGIVGVIFGLGHATLIEGSVVSGRPTPATIGRTYSR